MALLSRENPGVFLLLPHTITLHNPESAAKTKTTAANSLPSANSLRPVLSKNA
jgi:hypothetical protein